MLFRPRVQPTKLMYNQQSLKNKKNIGAGTSSKMGGIGQNSFRKWVGIGFKYKTKQK